LGATWKRTLPLPVPSRVEVNAIQSSLAEAAHEHPPDVAIVTEPSPPLAPNRLVSTVRSNEQAAAS
jgi:hypothetical protein